MCINMKCIYSAYYNIIYCIRAGKYPLEMVFEMLFVLNVYVLINFIYCVHFKKSSIPFKRVEVDR